MQTMETNEDLAMALALSYDYPIAILKVSNTCPLSRRVFDEFKKLEESDPELAEHVFVLIVQKSREVSDAISTRFGVVHESPQVLVFENEDVIYYESHEEVKLRRVEKFLREERDLNKDDEVRILEDFN